MKKSVIKVASMLFLGSLLVTACKKEKNEKKEDSTKTEEAKDTKKEAKG